MCACLVNIAACAFNRERQVSATFTAAHLSTAGNSHYNLTTTVDLLGKVNPACPVPSVNKVTSTFLRNGKALAESVKNATIDPKLVQTLLTCINLKLRIAS